MRHSASAVDYQRAHGVILPVPLARQLGTERFH